MGPGTYISAIGHIGLVGWLVVGVTFAPRNPPPEIQSVTLVSADVFNPAPADPITPEVPVVAEIEPPTIEAPQVAPEPTPAPTPEPVPEQPAPAPVEEPALPDPVVEPQPEPEPTPAPEPAPGPEPATTPEPAPAAASFAAPQSTMRPVPRPAARVADVNADGADDPAASQADVAQTQVATATEIVTDAQTPTGAPETAMRPVRRPARTAAVAEPTPAPAPDNNTDDSAVAAALAEAMAGASDTQQAAPEPLTSAELRGLQLQMHCWNVGSLSTDALASKIVVAVQLTRDGKPVPSSIELIETLEGTQAGASQAYEAARRGILECGRNGFDLPPEKFEFWQSLELVFNPESMRAK